MEFSTCRALALSNLARAMGNLKESAPIGDEQFKFNLSALSDPDGMKEVLDRVRQRGVISAVALGHRQAAFAVMCRG